MITGLSQSHAADALLVMLAGLAGLAGGATASVGGFPPVGTCRGADRDLRSHPGMAEGCADPGRR
jgi:hypothetical protein